MEAYKNTPSGTYIAKNRFRLLDVRASRLALIDEDSWSSLVRPGPRITLSVILTKVTMTYGDVCLGCGRQRKWSWISHRYTCSCGLVFYRYFNHATDETKTNTILKEDPKQAADHHELMPKLATPKASSTVAAKKTRRQQLKPSGIGKKQLDETDEPTLSSQNQHKIIKTSQDDGALNALDTDRRHVAVFKSVIFETTQRYQGILPFHLLPRHKCNRMKWRTHREITVDSKPCIINLLHSLNHGNDQKLATANISLQVEGLGNLWIQSGSPQPEICINGAP